MARDGVLRLPALCLDRLANFGLGSTSAGPTADPDADGQNNLFKFLAGTAPTNSVSFFTLGLTAPSAGQGAITFNPVTAGRTCTVEYQTNIVTGAFATLAGSTTFDNGPTRTVTDLNATNSARFYGVNMSLP